MATDTEQLWLTLQKHWLALWSETRTVLPNRFQAQCGPIAISVGRSASASVRKLQNDISEIICEIASHVCMPELPVIESEWHCLASVFDCLAAITRHTASSHPDFHSATAHMARGAEFIQKALSLLSSLKSSSTIAPMQLN